MISYQSHLAIPPDLGAFIQSIEQLTDHVPLPEAAWEIAERSQLNDRPLLSLWRGRHISPHVDDPPAWNAFWVLRPNGWAVCDRLLKPGDIFVLDTSQSHWVKGGGLPPWLMLGYGYFLHEDKDLNCMVTEATEQFTQFRDQLS